MACSAISRLTSQCDLQLLVSASVENEESLDNATSHSSVTSEVEGVKVCSLVNPKISRLRDREEDGDREFLESPKKKIAFEFDLSPDSMGPATTSSEETEKSLEFIEEAYICQGSFVEESDFELGLDLDEMRNDDILIELNDLRFILGLEQDPLFKKQLMTEFQVKVLSAASEFLHTKSFDRIPQVLSMIKGVSSFDHLDVIGNLVIQISIAGSQKNAMACLALIPDNLDDFKNFKSDLILFCHKIAHIQGDSSFVDLIAPSLSVEYQQQLREQNELLDVAFKKVDLTQLIAKVFSELEASIDSKISKSRQNYFTLFALAMGRSKRYELAAHVLSYLSLTPEYIETVRKLSLLALCERDFASFECLVDRLKDRLSVQDLLVYLSQRKELPFNVRVCLFRKLEQLSLRGDIVEEVGAFLCGEAYDVGHFKLGGDIFRSLTGEKFLPLINFKKDLCELKMENMFRINLHSRASLHISSNLVSRYKARLEMISLGNLAVMNDLLQDLPESFHDVCIVDVFILLMDQKKFHLARDFLHRFCSSSPRFDFMMADLAISAAREGMTGYFDEAYFDPRISGDKALCKANIRLECHLGRYSKAIEFLYLLPPLEESEFILDVLDYFLKNRQTGKVATFLKSFVPLYVNLQVNENSKVLFYKKAFKILIANRRLEDCLSFFSYVSSNQDKEKMFDAFILEQCSSG